MKTNQNQRRSSPRPLRLCGESSRRRRSAFTLIELLLVLVILGVLAAIVVPKFAGRSESARIEAARTDITNLGTALDTFELDAGRLPDTSEGLNALMAQPENVRAWKGPYVKKLPSDPWDRPYVYRLVDATTFELLSSGPNGQEGDADDINNLVNK